MGMVMKGAAGALVARDMELTAAMEGEGVEGTQEEKRVDMEAEVETEVVAVVGAAKVRVVGANGCRQVLQQCRWLEWLQYCPMIRLSRMSPLILRRSSLPPVSLV